MLDHLTARGNERRDVFRDDRDRDLVLRLGRKVCGMSIRELSQRAGVEEVSAARALGAGSDMAGNDFWELGI